MDSLTQIVLGAAVSEAAIGKKVGNKAMLWGAIAGTIPDLDVISRSFVDSVTALEYHRGFSHSLLFCVLAAPILGWLVEKIYKKKEATWKEWSWMFFLGLVTHPLLDIHTTWGTQFFWPLDLRIAYNNIFVADPLYTLPFLGLTLSAMFYRRTNPKRTKLNNLGLYISSSYMVLTILLKYYTFKKFEEALEKQSINYTEMSTRPSPLNSILWTANVNSDKEFFLGYYSIFDSDNDIEFERVAKNHDLLEDISEEDKIKRLIKISKGWYAVQKKEDGIYFSDLRFGKAGLIGTDAEFVFRYKIDFDNNNNLIAIPQQQTLKEGGKFLGQLWNRLKGI